MRISQMFPRTNIELRWGRLVTRTGSIPRASAGSLIALNLLLAACDGDGKMVADGAEASDSSTTGADDDENSESDETSTIPSIDLDSSGESGDEADPDSSGGAGDESVTQDCGEMDFEGKSVPPELVLVLDKSGSMSQSKWQDGGQTVTRWHSLYNTVEFLVGEFDQNIHFGAKVFPSLGSTKDEACTLDSGVDVDVGLGNGPAILDMLPGPMATVEGGTPSASALRETYDYIEALPGDRPKAVMLVMDGITEDCGDTDQQLYAAARKCKAAGIPVYVVGIDLNSATALAALDLLAKSGGTDQYYLSQNAAELEAAMTEIAGEVATCLIPLDEGPTHPDLVEVTLENGDEVPALLEFNSCEDAKDAGHERGWIYTSDSVPREEIELCGTTCEEFFELGGVNVKYSCPPPG